MSKTALTVFLCTHKDCNRAWDHVCDGSPGKWLKRQFEEAGLPYKLDVVKTDCMDRCKEAACLCLVHKDHARLLTDVRSKHDIGRLLAAAMDLVGVEWRVTERDS
ncbi:MAG: hypothetical protein K2R98_29245 [Gemmataceae bacterium]|nr:hypothetical protein [Gemmataceae bacterium]